MSTVSPPASRGSTVWAAAGLALAAVLGLAFYAVVSVQVLKAQSRQMDVQVRQTAFADCLQYVVGSTIASCGSRLGTQQPESTTAPPDLLLVSGR